MVDINYLKLIFNLVCSRWVLFLAATNRSEELSLSVLLFASVVMSTQNSKFSRRFKLFTKLHIRDARQGLHRKIFGDFREIFQLGA